jgi:hypothetical protein
MVFKKTRHFFNSLIILVISINTMMVFASPAPAKKHHESPPLKRQLDLDTVVFATHFSTQKERQETQSEFYCSGMTLDTFDSIYITGNEYQAKSNGGTLVLAKFSPEGKLLFSQSTGREGYLTVSRSVAIDRESNVWLAGNTNDPEFPLIDPWANDIPLGEYNIFFVKLSPTGDWLFSTLWGGSGNDQISCFCLDAEDNVYIAGTTTSLDLPLAYPLENTNSGDRSNFIASFSSDGTLRFSTYWLENKETSINALIVDTEQVIIIGGTTTSTELPVKNAFQEKRAGKKDAFLAKMSTKGDLLFCTYLGGVYDEELTSLAIGPEDKITVIGTTRSTEFPVKNPHWGSFDISNDENAFLSTFTKEGELNISDFLGSFYPSSVKRDEMGNYYIASEMRWRGYNHYPEAFHQVNVLTYIDDNSRIYAYLPNLRPFYSMIIDATWVNHIVVSPSSDYFCFSGNTSLEMTTKNAYQKNHYSDPCAVLGKFLLPPSLTKPNKALLQIEKPEMTIIQKGDVKQLPPLGVVPMIYQGRTLIPVRVLAETMGMEVSWVSEGQYIWLDRDGVRLELQIGRNFAWKYALNTPEKREKLDMDVPPMIVNNRTLLPLRFVAENFGALVDWNGFEQKILVSWE